MAYRNMFNSRTAALFVGFLAVLPVLYHLGWFQMLWANDRFFISTGIYALAVFAGLYALVTKKAESASYWATICTAGGLFGTVIGASAMLASISGGVAAMTTGAFVAFHTTAVGIVCFLFLDLLARWMRDE